MSERTASDPETKSDLLEEVYEAVKAIQYPAGQITLLIKLADSGHEAALEDAERIVRLPTKEFYNGFIARDGWWHHEYAIAGASGALARNKSFESALDLSTLITETYPRAEAYIQIGEAGFNVGYRLAIPEINGMVPGAREADLRRIAERLAKSGDIEELYNLKSALEQGYSSPLEPDYASVLVKAALHNDDHEMAHSIIDELNSNNSREALRILLQLAEEGDVLATSKAIKLSREKNDLQSLIIASNFLSS